MLNATLLHDQREPLQQSHLANLKRRQIHRVREQQFLIRQQRKRQMQSRRRFALIGRVLRRQAEHRIDAECTKRSLQNDPETRKTAACSPAPQEWNPIHRDWPHRERRCAGKRRARRRPGSFERSINLPSVAGRAIDSDPRRPTRWRGLRRHRLEQVSWTSSVQLRDCPCTIVSRYITDLHKLLARVSSDRQRSKAFLKSERTAAYFGAIRGRATCHMHSKTLKHGSVSRQ